MSRKTIEVDKVRNLVNAMLMHDGRSDAERKALCEVLSWILHETDTYQGFSYNGDYPHEGTKEDRDRIEYRRHYYGFQGKK